jgi:DNA polymerase-3 subunit delta'
MARAIDTLMKLCHDTACITLGAQPRWFDAAALRPARDLDLLLQWSRQLARIARDSEHPWNAPLLIETLVTRGSEVLA